MTTKQKHLQWETIHNTAEHCMWHIFKNGLRVLVDWNTQYIYLIDERGKTIEKINAMLSIREYEQYLQHVASFVI